MSSFQPNIWFSKKIGRGELELCSAALLRGSSCLVDRSSLPGNGSCSHPFAARGRLLHNRKLFHAPRGGTDGPCSKRIDGGKRISRNIVLCVARLDLGRLHNSKMEDHSGQQSNATDTALRHCKGMPSYKRILACSFSRADCIKMLIVRSLYEIQSEARAARLHL